LRNSSTVQNAKMAAAREQVAVGGGVARLGEHPRALNGAYGAPFGALGDIWPEFAWFSMRPIELRCGSCARNVPGLGAAFCEAQKGC
jgi:hypothetical protein